MTTTTNAAAVAAVPAGSIVVGIDGSGHSEKALAWAVGQAALEHRTLTLVHAANLNAGGDAALAGLPGLDVGLLLDDLRACGRTLLVDTVEQVRLLDPEVPVHPVLSTEDPRQLLLALSKNAAMLVIGSRGRGMVATLLLGSVSVSVSKHAACPVVVVRPQDDVRAHHGVLVGIDGTAETQGAVEFAYRTASLRGLPLTAVHVFWDMARVQAEDHDVSDDEPGLEDLRALLAESVAGMAEKFPDVQATARLVRGFRDRQLIRASAGMDLVVVGSRQRGFVADFVYGSVSPAVVEYAACDVAVVPARRVD